MKRPFVLVGLLIVFAGCANHKTTVQDPFFGKTAISAPKTWTRTQVATRDPYYSASTTNSHSSVQKDEQRGEAFPDPVATWESKDRRKAAAPASAWDAPAETDSSVRRASVESPRSDVAPVASTAKKRGRLLARVASRWRTDSTPFQTRIKPPELSPLANNATPLSPPSREADAASAASVDSSRGDVAKETATSTADSEPESFERVLQPRALPVEPRQTTHATVAASATEPVVAKASPDASTSGWRGPSSSSERSALSPTPARSVRPKHPGDLAEVTPLEKPRNIDLPDKVTDLRDLPRKSPRTTGQSREDGNVRLASHTAISGTSRGVQATTASLRKSPSRVSRPENSRKSASSPSLRYGYDPAYTWLRGRLEYSEVTRRWKLRYIPINGETDAHGGSVVLADSSLLDGLKKGDFVEIRGSLDTDEKGEWGYAPVYKVTQLKPVR